MLQVLLQVSGSQGSGKIGHNLRICGALKINIWHGTCKGSTESKSSVPCEAYRSSSVPFGKRYHQMDMMVRSWIWWWNGFSYSCKVSNIPIFHPDEAPPHFHYAVQRFLRYISWHGLDKRSKGQPASGILASTSPRSPIMWLLVRMCQEPLRLYCFFLVALREYRFSYEQCNMLQRA